MTERNFDFQFDVLYVGSFGKSFTAQNPFDTWIRKILLTNRRFNIIAMDILLSVTHNITLK